MMHEFSDSFMPVQINSRLRAYIWQGMGNNCNSLLFTDVFNGPRPHVLVDPGHTDNGFSNCFQNLEKAVEHDGFKIDEVGMVINTHSHTDHCQANELLAKNNSISIAMTEEEDKFRQTLGKRLDAMFGTQPPEFKVTSYLKEGPLEIGDKNPLKLELFISPGHSPGSVCLYMPSDKILITGDVVFYYSVGRTDFPGGNTEMLGKSIERLSKLDVDCLIPGHSTEMGSIIEGKKDVEKNFQAVKSFFR